MPYITSRPKKVVHYRLADGTHGTHIVATAYQHVAETVTAQQLDADGEVGYRIVRPVSFDYESWSDGFRYWVDVVGDSEHGDFLGTVARVGGWPTKELAQQNWDMIVSADA